MCRERSRTERARRTYSEECIGTLAVAVRRTGRCEPRRLVLLAGVVPPAREGSCLSGSLTEPAVRRVADSQPRRDRNRTARRARGRQDRFDLRPMRRLRPSRMPTERQWQNANRQRGCEMSLRDARKIARPCRRRVSQRKEVSAETRS